MKAVVLAGGFAKRMWPLTKNKPKVLLQIAGKPILDYIIEILEPIPTINKIFIDINKKFENHFSNYLKQKTTKKDISLFIEDTHSEMEKLGSVGGLSHLIRETNIEDELLVVGGDNILSFNMFEFIDYFKSINANTIALCNVKSKLKARLYGVVNLDHNNKIIDFEEKPYKPKSTLVSTACYAFTQKGVNKILNYIDKGKDPDKMGSFIQWLYKNDIVYGFIFKGIWFDIGSFESYNEANIYFSNKYVNS
jgi:glucose-1-phosphate thymidylyltransferase